LLKIDFIKELGPGKRLDLAGSPPGIDAGALAALVRQGNDVLHVARDDTRLTQLAEGLRFMGVAGTVLTFPAWDCLPYDRVSPNGEVVSRRLDCLVDLAQPPDAGKGRRILLTTVNAITQRVPARAQFARAMFRAEAGAKLRLDALLAFLVRDGYRKAETVREPGEYALRGGIVDLFPPGLTEPVRLDLFGDTLEAIRRFDPMSQKSTGRLDAFALKPVSEVLLDPASIERFRLGYREHFGAPAATDGLYAAVSAGQRYGGLEHWLPLFHESLETLFDYLPGAVVSLDPQAEEAAAARFEQIVEFHDARALAREAFSKGKSVDKFGESASAYNPLPANLLYLAPAEWKGLLAKRAVVALSPFAKAPGAKGLDAGGSIGIDFSADRAKAADTNLFDAVRARVATERAGGRRVLICAYSAGSRERLAHLMREHGITETATVATWDEAAKLPMQVVATTVLGIETGFRTDDVAAITEQDILGDRLVRAQRKRRRPENFLTEASALGEGDLVVHVEHGIGRYDGLATIEVAGAPHDCLRILYADNDKLFVPVENIDTLTRYGSEDAGAQLDKLGGAGWQARKSRVKKRIAEIAGKLIQMAAERQMREGEKFAPPEGLFDEFCARFPFQETEDQARAISDAIDDLAAGKPMDRLVCGDVGFGKTEVALRAAFVAAMAGVQVAVVVPTTLLARQHFKNFTKRFEGFPIRIAQLSRLVPAKDQAQARIDAEAGRIEIVIGTTALLAKGIKFQNLGLVIVDEEQHFGVAQKERLKEMRADVHVLTLTATPIPRTLQMALTGVRDLSLIASPPVDRLAVRSFVLPFDPVVIREAILREKFRGGQVFYVVPRIEDLGPVRERLETLVPECRLAVAHGQLPPTQIESVMSAFVDGAYDVLLSTNIVESGLDIPAANTIVIHRADMFGLAQLYQLRGRVGRAKLRAYAYFTVPGDRVPTQAAQKRLEVMQTLDSLGAGFQLASYDLDIRGAGNLLGEEQSGHIREVGVELYQQLLEEAVRSAKETGAKGEAAVDEWSPQIGMGMPVLIPETYVQDLTVRLGLYRRVANMAERSEIDSFAAELVDRFGAMPEEVRNLLDIIELKRLCRAAGVDKVDAGPKGAVLGFRKNRFARPDKLVDLMMKRPDLVKLRPDHKLVYMRAWDTPEDRLKGMRKFLGELAKLAA
jgi:transcription-repair coupling factor (superfamily II helicase)